MKAYPSRAARPTLETLDERAVPALIASQVFAPFATGALTGEFALPPGVTPPDIGILAPGTAPFVRTLQPVEGVPQLPPDVLDCVQEFMSLNEVSPLPTQGQGQGQPRYYVCHFTGSAAHPYELNVIAGPAAFGGHLRHGDLVLTRAAPTGGVFVTFLNAQGQVETAGPF